MGREGATGKRGAGKQQGTMASKVMMSTLQGLNTEQNKISVEVDKIVSAVWQAPVEINATEIRATSLEAFEVSVELADAACAAWNALTSRFESQSAADDAVYSAFFEASPSIQMHFTSPRGVLASKFTTCVHQLVMNMRDGFKLQKLVETLGFQHLHLEITSNLVMMIRDSILELFDAELSYLGLFDQKARDGLHMLLNYVGGGLMYVRNLCTERLQLISESWCIATNSSKGREPLVAHHSEMQASSALVFNDKVGSSSESHGKEATNDTEVDSDAGNSRSSSEKESEGSGHASQTVKTSFNGMFHVNASVMGFVNYAWMIEVLESFDAIVQHVDKPNRLQEETDCLALKISSYDQDAIDLNQFKACMLAALRSVLPLHWTPPHEVAWVWLWENVARLLENVRKKPPLRMKSLRTFLESLDANQTHELRTAIYERFFEVAPAGQDYFKQSNTRLHFIMDRVLEKSVQVYEAPKKIVSVISALGLRHVEFGIPTDFFGPFVTSCIEVLNRYSTDLLAVEAFRWSLGLVAKILIRTIVEGATAVMKAVNANSLRQLRKAVSCAPRSARATCVLHIQVGSTHMSPLFWAIESGKVDIANAILKDILTIRADRMSYYYGVDELFGHHSDITKRLTEDMPVLLPTLLDGLVWRSHRPERGMRRVNLYVKHMLVNAEGGFADSLKYLAASGDPAIISHPVSVLVSNTLWNGIIYKRFIYFKMWNIFTLILFMFTQGILPQMRETGSGGGNQETTRQINIVIFCGRLFTYVFGMGRLACFHLSRIWNWSRTTMKRIFDEIDEDKSGTIEWAELKQASVAFKQSVKEEIVKAMRMLRDDDGPATMDEARKAIATQQNKMYTIISLVLMALLAIMACNEPMLWCTKADGWPTDVCDRASADLLYRYSILSMIALAIHWLILIDLVVFSTSISAFLLVCGHVMAEVKQFLCATGFLLLTFGSAISVRCRKCDWPDDGADFSTMSGAMLSLFAMTVSFYEVDFRGMTGDPVLLTCVFLFVTLSCILLLNLLIAQLNRSYEYIYYDMLGFARLNRASLIVDGMASVPKSKWQKFVSSLGFDNKLEFGPGDVGLSGGIQTYESLHLHQSTTDTIIRVGGSVSPSMPWPEEADDQEDGEDAQFERLEKLLRKALKRIENAGDASGSGAIGKTFQQSGGGSSEGSQEVGDSSELD